jgi:YVTN family beta-propeller protein
MNVRRERTHFGPAGNVGLLFIAAAFSFDLLISARALPPANSANAAELETHSRRPVALSFATDRRRLFVANRRSGSVSVVDVEQKTVVDEFQVGRKLVDLVGLPRSRLLAVDESEAQLVLLNVAGTRPQIVDRMTFAATPVSVEVSIDGGRAAVASLWPRQVTLVEIAGPERAKSDKADGAAVLRTTRTVSLPFAPRKLLFDATGERLVAADAFGGALAVLDVAKGELISTRKLPAHNIRGLAVGHDGRRPVLLLSHQSLSPLARSDLADVHWGNLITNNLRRLRLDALLAARDDWLAGSRLDFLGDVGRAAGDPAGIAMLPDGRAAIALAGVDEIMIERSGALGFERVAVGRRPTALVALPDGKQIYVANTLDDSISVIDASVPKVTNTISLGPQPAPDAADRGERLFYDARLSHDGWMSCHSCHTDGHTNGHVADTFSDGSFGTPKRVSSLLGVGDTAPYAWNGGMSDLETQIRASVSSTMNGAAPTDEQVADLAAFLRTLAPVAAADRATVAADAGGVNDGVAPQDAVAHGRDVFLRQKCDRCHTPPSYTSRGVYDVELPDEAGLVEFNPPSLRGVVDRQRLFHDHRASDLDEVFTRWRHQLQGDLDGDELRSLIIFLRSL